MAGVPHIIYRQVVRDPFLFNFIGRTLAASIRKKVSLQARKECVMVAMGFFDLIFTCYRLSGMSLLYTLDYVGQKLTVISTRRMRKSEQKHSELEEYQGSRWSKELPEDIMQLVLQRPELSVSDCLRCCAVCPSWRAAVDTAIASRHCCLAACELPWLMLCSHPFSLKQHRFLSLSDQRIYNSSPTNYTNRLDCVGSIEGWLIMVDSAFRRPEGFMKPWNDNAIVNFFLNPISGARVMLPSQSTIPSHESNHPSFIQKVRASSVPTSQHCVVAARCSGNHLAFCRPTDKSWTLIDGEARGLHFLDIEILGGKLYAATWDASEFLMVFDIQNANGRPPRVERLVMLHPRPVPLNFWRRDGAMCETERETVYLSKDSTSNELFMILRRNSYALDEDPIIPWSIFTGNDFLIPPKNVEFRVFKLEHTTDGPRWVQVVHLGDRILFLSNSSSIVIPAPSLNGTNTLQTNCIYFAFESPCFTSLSSGYDAGVFTLTNNTIEPYAFFKDHSRTRLLVKPVWFTPKFW